LAELLSYTIPNLIQGISQQPDAQRDPSQGEVQINAMSSAVEGLRKRDSSHTLARVSDVPFGDCFIHSILRDQSEEYLAVIAKDAIRVFDLQGNEKVVRTTGSLGYLDSVSSAKDQIRAVSIADYTFVLNTTKAPATIPLLAPVPSRPSAYEALVWVKAANYSQTYSVYLNGTEAKVATAVAPVVSSGDTNVENRISSEAIADALMLTLQGRLTGVAAITPVVPIDFQLTRPSGLQLNAGGVFLGEIASITQVTAAQMRGVPGKTYPNLITTSNGLGFGATVTVTQTGTLPAALADHPPTGFKAVTLGAQGSGYRVGDFLSINAQALTGDVKDSTNLPLLRP
jgi:hypothetical protein